jgi:hypothetical protein
VIRRFVAELPARPARPERPAAASRAGREASRQRRDRVRSPGRPAAVRPATDGRSSTGWSRPWIPLDHHARRPGGPGSGRAARAGVTRVAVVGEGRTQTSPRRTRSRRTAPPRRHAEVARGARPPAERQARLRAMATEIGARVAAARANPPEKHIPTIPMPGPAGERVLAIASACSQRVTGGRSGARTPRTRGRRRPGRGSARAAACRRRERRWQQVRKDDREAGERMRSRRPAVAPSMPGSSWSTRTAGPSPRRKTSCSIEPSSNGSRANRRSRGHRHGVPQWPASGVPACGVGRGAVQDDADDEDRHEGDEEGRRQTGRGGARDAARLRSTRAATNAAIPMIPRCDRIQSMTPPT